LTGTENARAHLRASPSSRMAVHPGLAIAQARTAVSPTPRSQASSSGRAEVSRLCDSHLQLSSAAQDLDLAQPIPRKQQDLGQLPDLPESGSIPRSTRARTIKGDAFNTQRSGTGDLVDDLVCRILEGRDPKIDQSV
jgi:hypothetical protein